MRIFELDVICRNLSPRETTVLQLTIAGERGKEMARSLDLSHRTIETHQEHIRKKLGARNTADMIRIALRGRGV